MPERTDKELLELAAKAAGYEYVTFNGDEVAAWSSRNPTKWNPLTDYGDALRLAAALNMTVTAMTAFCGAKPNFGGQGVDLPTLGDDKCAVLCRAIVMVAAEIGANMQS